MGPEHAGALAGEASPQPARVPAFTPVGCQPCDVVTWPRQRTRLLV